jgi:hypothetical protein
VQCSTAQIAASEEVTRFSTSTAAANTSIAGNAEDTIANKNAMAYLMNWFSTQIKPDAAIGTKAALMHTASNTIARTISSKSVLSSNMASLLVAVTPASTLKPGC